MSAQACPLCAAAVSSPWQTVRALRFWRCPGCDLIFKDPAHWPARAAEHTHYGTHQNDPDDQRYRDFLDRCFAPLCAHLAPGAEGIDFGCGPGPALPRIAAERGLRMASWDPAFTPDSAPLRRCYDFLVATEVLEHLHQPAATLARMDDLVRPGGWIAVMTLVWRQQRPWAQWHYWNDPTHVCFYTPAALAYIAERWRYTSITPHPNVRLWLKPS